MAINFLTAINLNTQELRNAVLQNLSTPPAGTKGQTYFDTNTNHSFVHNGTSWEQASGVAGGGGAITSIQVLVSPAWLSVAPSTPVTSGVAAFTIAAPSQPQGQVLAAPATGGPGPPGFRALAGTDLPPLNQVPVPTAPVNLNNWSITGLATPVGAQDATNKTYVDAAIQGTPVKPTAKCSTVAALPAYAYNNGTAGFNATLTGNINGAIPSATLDGQTVAVNDLVLVKNEVSANAPYNGLYSVTNPGSGGAQYVLTRQVDMDTTGEYGGAMIAVETGTAFAGSLWMCTTNAPSVGMTPVAFTQLNQPYAPQAGTGISIVGNTISISATYAGQTSITTLGTIATGMIPVANGGTGATTATQARINLGVNTLPVPGKYQATFAGGSTTWQILQSQHLLASDQSILVAVYDATNKNQVYPDVSVDPTNGTVTISFAVAPTSGQYRVVLIG